MGTRAIGLRGLDVSDTYRDLLVSSGLLVRPANLLGVWASPASWIYLALPCLVVTPRGDPSVTVHLSWLLHVCSLNLNSLFPLLFGAFGNPTGAGLGVAETGDWRLQRVLGLALLFPTIYGMWGSREQLGYSRAAAAT